MRIALSAVAALILIGAIVLGMIGGFPWERIEAVNTASQYVTDIYGFSPTYLQAHLFWGGRGNGVTVSSKELGFFFDVYIDRNNLNHVSSDSYLKNLIEYKIQEGIKKDIGPMLGAEERIGVGLWVGLPFGSPKAGITTERVDTDFDAVVSELANGYYLLIISKKNQVNGFIPDYQNVFNILRTVLDKWQPESVSFWYYGADDSKRFAVINIQNDELHNIDEPDDLIQYFSFDSDL